MIKADNLNKGALPVINSSPFFSVIITTYNRSGLLRRAVNSLVMQTEKDWEAIIVDDESTDDTYDQISHFLKEFPNIRYISHNHQGEALSKNTGIQSAKGRFITFLDSDDEYDPTHLEIRKDLLTKNPSVKFLYGGVTILGNQFVPDRFDYSKRINLNSCIIGGTFFIDRNTTISLNGFKNILVGADSDMFDRAKERHVNMMEVTQPTYIYHHETEDSITNTLFESL